MKFLSMSLLVVLTGAATLGAPGYHLLKTVPVGGDGGWDYLTVDDAGRRVYVSHATEVVVIDADSYVVKGKIAGLKGVHGIAVAPDLGRGFISDGKANSVVIFDLKTLKPIGKADTGKNPDAVIYDASSGRVIAFNRTGKSATVIDAKDGNVAGTIELGGAPEFAAADGKGSVYVNLDNNNEVLKIDVGKLTVLERWPVAPGESPASMVMDTKNRRLFIGCHNKLLVVMNADNGKVVDKQAIGARVDASAFDPETALVFCSNGDGTVTVIHQDSADKYAVVETVKTQSGSRTMALDAKTHRFFLPAAQYGPAAGKQRPVMVPGSFSVQVYGR
jgi:DNA-binding beta-propeller fold protein YncE